MQKAFTETDELLMLDDALEIKRGGEGRILLLKEKPDKVAKIYLNSKSAITPAQINALQGLDSTFFVKPLECLYEAKGKKKGELIGFIMDLIDVQHFPLSALFSPQFSAKNRFDESQKLILAKKITKAIAHAHAQGIVVGDLSGLNILVNPNGDFKFIDVDSYQTAVQTHSGVLLDDIRDYYYQGLVSKNSDFFALSVIVFNLLTFTHPFKGVHSIFKGLAERMIQQIPVFANDSRLIVPKCFQPIQNIDLQQQFEKIFMKGDRFLISLDAIPSPTTHIAAPTVIVPQGDMTVKTLYEANKNEILEDVWATEKQVLVRTNQQFLIFDAANYGYANIKTKFLAQDADNVFIGEEKILKLKNNLLSYYLPAQQHFQELQNFAFTDNSRWVQYKNLLAVVEDNLLKFIYLDEVNKNFVRNEQTAAFGKGLHTGYGLWQQTGGKQFMFYHSGKTLSSALAPLPLYDVRSIQNIGLMTVREASAGEVRLQNYWFQFIKQTGQVQVSKETADSLKHFAVRSSATQSLVFEPMDNKLLVRRADDFKPVQEILCGDLSEQSFVFSTQAGIVVLENNRLLLLNKK